MAWWRIRADVCFARGTCIAILPHTPAPGSGSASDTLLRSCSSTSLALSSLCSFGILIPSLLRFCYIGGVFSLDDSFRNTFALVSSL